jgi:hypothetical protein
LPISGAPFSKSFECTDSITSREAARNLIPSAAAQRTRSNRTPIRETLPAPSVARKTSRYEPGVSGRRLPLRLTRVDTRTVFVPARAGRV